MADFVFLDRDLVLAIHEEQLALHGGGVGVRDEGLLESALGRPVNRLAYDEDADCAALAAAYAFGLAKNHPFIDGNKRTALVALELCLRLNGFSFNVDDQTAVLAMLQLAAGEIDEEDLTFLIKANLCPVSL